MSESTLLSVNYTIKAAPAEVYRGFTHATLLRDWLSTVASSDPHPGGYLFLRWGDGRTVTGTYQQLDRPTHVSFTWNDTQLPVQTVLQVTFQAEGENTRLSLKQSSQEDGRELDRAAAGLETFWTDALENLASVIETGIDLRLARRPRLGIMMDEFTPEKAGKLGVPVKEGVLIAGTAEGTGARAAGLEKDDVLVSLNGKPLAAPTSFAVALVGLKAGDCPIVEYYRGPEKCSVALELGHFPIPELPATAREVADQVNKVNAEVMDALRAQLEGLSEEQASLQPAEGEWSVKELVAHFILAERDYQSWVADMLNDTPIEDWLMNRSNVTPRLSALITRLQTLPALLNELAQAKAETAATIDAFPESFARDRKHLFRRAAQWEIEGKPAHYYEEHREQFQTAIDKARQQLS